MTWKRDTFKTVFVQSAGWLGFFLKHGGAQRVEVKKMSWMETLGFGWNPDA